MKIILSRTNRKLYQRFLFSYFAVLLIPVLINTFTYQQSLKNVKEYSIEVNVNQVTKIMEQIDNQLNEIDALIPQISNDRIFRKLMNTDSGITKGIYLDYNTCISRIYNYAYNNKLLESANYYIYFKNTDYIMTADTLYSPNLYYTSVIRNYKPDAEGFATWYETIRNGGKQSERYLYDDCTSVGYPNDNSILYMKAVPIRLDGKVMGTIVIEISKAQLRSYFSDYTTINNGYFYIQNADGSMVLHSSNLTSAEMQDITSVNPNFSESTGETLRIGGRKMIAMSVTSKKTGWSYVVLTPEDVLFSDLQKVQRTNLLLFCLLYVCGTAVALLFTSRNSKPILNMNKRIYEFLGMSELGREDPYIAINSGISKLISNQISMQQDVLNQKPYLQNSFLNNLIFGKMYGESAMYAMAQYVDIDIGGEGFFVASIRTYNDASVPSGLTAENIEELYIWKSIVRNTYLRCFGKNIILHEVSNMRLAVIFSLSPDNLTAEQFKRIAGEAIETANNELKDTYNMSIFIGIGGYCRSAFDIWSGYEQAETALDYAWGEEAVIWYDNICTSNDQYYYPAEMDLRLHNLTLAGDFEQVQRCLDILFEENFIRRKLSVQQAHEMMIEMRSTLNKLAAKNNTADIGKRIAHLHQKTDTAERFNEIQVLYRLLCESRNYEKKNSSHRLIEQIQEYIDLNYAVPDLGLYKIASRFNLSEGYFSFFFKEQTGINFTDYLEKVRLDKAEELLRSTNHTIDAIAHMVGYNSGQSFRRAFKKVHSVSPTAIRAAIQ